MTPPDSEADPGAEALCRIGKGDLQALRSLIEEWKRPLIAFFYRSTGSLADSEELAFNTFERLYRAAPRYQPTARFSTFLFTIARNLLTSHYRRKQSRPRLEGDHPVEEGVSHPETAASDLRESLNIALSRLDTKYRTPLLLSAQQGLDHATISAILDISIANVKVRIHRARQFLKEQLENPS